MRDLYKRLSLLSDATREQIEFNLALCADAQLIEDARAILLDEERRKVYDQNRKVLAEIGVLRARLVCGKSEFWQDSEDFTKSAAMAEKSCYLEFKRKVRERAARTVPAVQGKSEDNKSEQPTAKKISGAQAAALFVFLVVGTVAAIGLGAGLLPSHEAHARRHQTEAREETPGAKPNVNSKAGSAIETPAKAILTENPIDWTPTQDILTMPKEDILKWPRWTTKDGVEITGGLRGVKDGIVIFDGPNQLDVPLESLIPGDQARVVRRETGIWLKADGSIIYGGFIDLTGDKLRLATRDGIVKIALGELEHSNGIKAARMLTEREAFSASSQLDSEAKPPALRHLASDQRPFNGAIVRNLFVPGTSNASLTMINGLDEDAFVKLIRDGRCIASFYVRSGNQYSFKGVSDGSYTVLFCTGFGWNPTEEDFTRGRQAQKYDRPLTFSTRVVTGVYSSTTYFDEISLTLHKTPAGNTSTSSIPLSEFDKY